MVRGGVRRTHSRAASHRARRADELDRVLSHEFVHAVVAMLGGRTVPAWVNEGLATVLEPAGVAMRKPRWPEPTRGRRYRPAPELQRPLQARRRNRLRIGGAGRAPLDRSAGRGGGRCAPERSGARRAVRQRLRATNRDALRGFRGAGRPPLEPLIARKHRPPRPGLIGLTEGAWSFFARLQRRPELLRLRFELLHERDKLRILPQAVQSGIALEQRIARQTFAAGLLQP